MSLRLTSKKTLSILLTALQLRSFTQTLLAEHSHASIGRVNALCSFLQEKSVIIKEDGKYHVAQPNKLIDMIASQVTIKKTRTYDVSRHEVVRIKGVKCLFSAINEHSKTPDEYESHYMDTHQLQEQLDDFQRGDYQVHLYDISLYVEASKATHPIQTIIDMRAIGQNQRVEKMSSDLWGTRQ